MEFNFTAEDLVADFVPELILGRYPYTYAADFLRAHSYHSCRVLGVPEENFSSRAEANLFMDRICRERGAEPYEYGPLAVIFADAYLMEYGIGHTSESRMKRHEILKA